MTMLEHDARAYASASAKHDAPAHATYVRTDVLTQMYSPREIFLRSASRAGGLKEIDSWAAEFSHPRSRRTA